MMARLTVRCFHGAVFGIATAPVYASSAASNSAAISPSGSLLQVILALALVLVMMLGAAWFFKRLGLLNFKQQLPVKVIGGLNLGNRERVMVVEVANQWLVLGVTSQQISTLATLNKQDDLLLEPKHTQNQTLFADWLQKKLDKGSNTGASSGD